MKSLVLCAAVVAISASLVVARAQARPCVGDCNDDGEVTVDELVAGASIALGAAPLAQCPASDCDGSGQVTVACLVQAVGVALGGCAIGICGNGVVEYVEECDDGNADPSDGCTNACTICGNGTVRAPEECDDGNRIDDDGCDSNCTLAACGNGVVSAGEQCDDGNTTPCDGCTPTCQVQRCGDGVLDPDCEQCDDGNASNADGCTANCQISYCGDGFLNLAAEECDDGNRSSCDGCSAACRTESGFCGDGVLDANCEQCDDGNTSDTDACRNDCTAADVPGRVGPGNISALVIDPHTPATLYARAECGGVLKSTDGGDTWSVAASGLPLVDGRYYRRGPLAIDPLMPHTLYAGSLDAPTPVYKSTDSGSSWEGASTGLPVPFCSGCGDAFAINPVTPSTVYYGGALGLDGDGGLFRSTDGASTWISTGLRAPRYLYALIIDPATPGTIYAGTEPGGVFKSTDAGSTWISANTGLPGPYLGVLALAIDPKTPGTLYAGLYSGVFKSTDGGSTWTTASTGLPDGSVVALAIDPGTSSTLYAGTLGGVFKTMDGGDTWRRANTGMPPVVALAIDPTSPRTLYAVGNRGDEVGGIHGGVYKSTDGGAIWLATGLAGDPRCGDGVRCGYEECDDGNSADGDGCDSNCRPTGCGNGVVTAGEECDDGNRRPCDGCSRTCQSEAGLCGDGVLYADCEQCDDGNRSQADACRDDCRLNVCGDGVVNPTAEECDDGNQVSGDGCDRDCTPTVCGNGIVTAGEECDDGNTTPCDGCTPTCKIQRCGDGHLDADCGEQCDDGNANPFDGCTAACTVCGDGIVTPPEQCEDGNSDLFDGCTTACTTCGDRVVTPPEQCDDGNLIDGDGCDASCTITGCGNAVLQGDEACDDGNTTGGDGCAANCTREHMQRFVLDPAQSSMGFQPHGARISLALSGALTVRTGRQRESEPDVPLAIRVGDLRVDPIPLPSFGCLCIAAAADPAIGSGNAGGGTIVCGDAGLSGVDIAASIDHNTDDTDRTCRNGVVEAAATCGDGICRGGASDGRSCQADFDCAPHPGVCNGREATTLSGPGPSGSAVIEVSLASWTLPNCSVDPDDPRKGPDGMPCTDDDPTPRSTVVRQCGYGGCTSLSFLPPQVQVRLTTGTAGAEILDANNVPGAIIAAGASCDDNACMTEATGRPFTCSMLGATPHGGVAGAALAGAFGALDHRRFGDIVTTLVLGLGAPLPVACVGDCDQSGAVTVAELVTGVNGALSNATPDDCPLFDTNGDRRVTVDELIAAVDAALDGCGP